MIDREGAATEAGHRELRMSGKADDALLREVDRRIFAWATETGCPDATIFELRLVSEELLTNVINHGAAGGVAPQVRFALFEREDEIVIHFDDDGPAFDPLSLPPPDVRAPLEQRKIGGLGVHLVRELMDSVSYRREKGWNRLTLVCRNRINAGSEDQSHGGPRLPS